jgi:hypothetical protein
MYLALLFQQWKWTRLVIVLGAVAAFAVPLLSVRGAGAGMAHKEAAQFLGSVQLWGVLYPSLAGAIGVLTAITLWTPDHRGRHVYSLALPVARWRYVLLRYGAGLALVGVPIVALLVGSVLAALTTSLPPGLHAYPLALSVRFALALLVAFTMFFAVSSGTARTAGIILGGFAALVVTQVLLSAAGTERNLVLWVINALLASPGPFAVFTGRWMLIDV